MAKVSASTLIRRANKAKDKTVAKRLRTRAAKMRSEARAKKARGNVAGRADRAEAPATQTIVRTRQTTPAEQAMVMHHDAFAGWKEIGHDTSLIAPDQLERMRGYAKKRPYPNVDSFAIAVRAALVDAKVAGKHEAEKGIQERFAAHNEAQQINVVCAFLAEMNGITALNKGPLPRVVMVSGYTLARVVDALRKAGYTEEGKQGMRRPL